MFGTSSTPISSCLVDLYVLPSEIHLYVGPHRLIHFHVLSYAIYVVFLYFVGHHHTILSSLWITIKRR